MGQRAILPRMWHNPAFVTRFAYLDHSNNPCFNTSTNVSYLAAHIDLLKKITRPIEIKLIYQQSLHWTKTSIHILGQLSISHTINILKQALLLNPQSVFVVLPIPTIYDYRQLSYLLFAVVVTLRLLTHTHLWQQVIALDTHIESNQLISVKFQWTRYNISALSRGRR